MLRRTFFRSIFSNLALLLLPKWARAQLGGSREVKGASLNDVGMVALPSSLGPKAISEITAAFQKWILDYPAGADAGYGYGLTDPKVLGANPSLRYAEQLKRLDAAAADKGKRFAELSGQDKAAILQSELSQAGAAAIPERPDGKHVATDLMSYFYNSSDGIDFCYNAAIRRSDCRGLGSSARRPAPLR